MEFSTRDICQVAGVSEKQFGMWMSRGTFTSEATRYGKGNARAFSLVDAKHLYLMGHLTSLGVSPALAEAIWRGASRPEDLHLTSTKVVLILPGARLTYTTEDNIETLDKLPPVAVIVRVGALYAAVDTLLGLAEAAA